jgi:hypothetical protein
VVTYIVYVVSILWKVSGHVYCVCGIDIVESERSRILCMWYRYCGKGAVTYIVYVISILWKVSGHVYCVCGIDIASVSTNFLLF